MPYVNVDTRQKFLPFAGIAHENPAENVGELTFLLTIVCDEYIIKGEGVDFARLSQVVAALDCAKMEFYRRVLSLYENHKKEENGDVYLSLFKINELGGKT